MRIWISGASGFLGARLKKLLECNHTVAAPDSKACDIGNYAAVRNEIHQAEPQLIIHCAAIGDISRCQADPQRAMQINVAGTRHIASACAELGIPMITISSDQVYDYYTLAPLDEYVAPDPTNFYGKTKLFGEQIVRSMVPRHYILRLGWQYGRHEAGLPDSRDGLVEHLTDCLKRDQPVLYTPGARQNVTYIYDTAAAVCAMAEGTLPYGTYNIASENGKTDYETKAYILQRLGAGQQEIRRLMTAQENAAPFDLRAKPLNLSLAGYRFPNFEEGLERCMEGETI